MAVESLALEALKVAIGREIEAPVSAFVSTIKRRLQLKKLVKGEGIDRQSAIIASAVSDLRSVFGREGLITEKLDQFFNLLKSRNILSPLAIASYFELDVPSLRVRFYYTYIHVFGTGDGEIIVTTQGDRGNHPAIDLLRVIANILQKSIALQIGEPAHFLTTDWRQTLVKAGIEVGVDAPGQILASYRNDISALEKSVQRTFVQRSADGTLLQLGTTQDHFKELVLSEKAVKDIAVRLNMSLITHYRDIYIQGTSDESRTADIEEVYIPARLKTKHIRTAQLAQLRNQNLEQISYERLFKLSARALVLGDPGSGKSTLLRRICFDLSKERQRNGNWYVPIFVELRKYETARKHSSVNSIMDFLATELRRQSNDLENPELLEVLKWILTFGNVLVGLDGLDEILDINSRREVVREISQFVDRYPLSKYIISSREVGYSNAPVGGFDEFVVSPFGDAEVSAYYQAASRRVFNLPESRIAENVGIFLGEVKRQAPDFMGNALLLSLMVWIFNLKKRIPDNRLQVYEECVVLLIERWDKVRLIEPRIPDLHRIRALLTHLAPDFYLNTQAIGGSTEGYLKRAIREFFVRIYFENAEERAEEVADLFLQHLAGRAFVLRMVADDRYEFVHRTFLEYFFARNLRAKYRSSAKLIEAVSGQIQQREWNVPIHLCLQMLVNDNIQEADEASQALLKQYNQCADAASRVSVAHFVAEACQYVQPREFELVSIAELIIDNATSAHEWSKMFWGIVKSSNEMRDVVLKGLVRGIDKVLQRANLGHIGFLVDWLYAIRIRQSDVFVVQDIERLDNIIPFADLVSKQLEKTPLLSDVLSPAAAKARIDLGTVPTSAIVELYGLNLWAASLLPGNRANWLWVDMAMVISEVLDVIDGRRRAIDSRYYQLGLGLFRALPKLVGSTMPRADSIYGVLKTDWMEKLETLEVSNIEPDALRSLFVGLVLFKEETLRRALHLTRAEFATIQSLGAKIIVRIAADRAHAKDLTQILRGDPMVIFGAVGGALGSRVLLDEVIYGFGL